MLNRVARALIFLRTDFGPPVQRAQNMLVSSNAHLVPTIYDELKLRRRRTLRMMFAFIALPTVIASVYYGLIASDRYISETRMLLGSEQAGAGRAAGTSQILAVMGMSGGGGGSDNETAIVVDYLQSSEAMDALDKAIGLRKLWSANSIDYISRLPANASQETFFRYYKNHVRVTADPQDPVIQVDAAAFRPADARLINSTLVALAQDKLNGAFLQMREDALKVANKDVADAEARLRKVETQLRDYRNTHREIDPAQGVQTVGSVTGSLFGQLAAAEADLKTVLSYQREDSPQVKNLQARIAALNAQIAANRSILAGDPGKQPYTNMLADYQNLQLEDKFAQDSYTQSLALLAQSRAELTHQRTYLVDFLAPNLPQEAMEPQRVRDIFFVLIASLLAYLIVTLVISALREHATL